MRSARGKWEEALSAHAASKTLGGKAPLKRDICRIRRIKGFGPTYTGGTLDHYN
jgi:hypothetical protein